LQAFCHSHRLYLEIKLPAKKTFLSRSICFLGCLLCIISINVKSICRDIVLADEAHIFSPTLLSSDFNYHTTAACYFCRRRRLAILSSFTTILSPHHHHSFYHYRTSHKDFTTSMVGVDSPTILLLMIGQV
jgi:hypothetical protein